MPIGVEGYAFNTSGMDERLSVLQPCLIKGTEPMAGIMDVVVRRHDDGFRELPEGWNQFFERFDVLAPADFQPQRLQLQQSLRQIVLLAGELGVGEPEDDAVGLQGLAEEGVDGVVDEVDAGGEGGEGDDEFVFVAGGVRLDAAFRRLPAIPWPIAQLDVLAPGFAKARHPWKAGEFSVDCFQKPSHRATGNPDIPQNRRAPACSRARSKAAILSNEKPDCCNMSKTEWFMSFARLQTPV